MLIIESWMKMYKTAIIDYSTRMNVNFDFHGISLYPAFSQHFKELFFYQNSVWDIWTFNCWPLSQLWINSFVIISFWSWLTIEFILGLYPVAFSHFFRLYHHSSALFKALIVSTVSYLWTLLFLKNFHSKSFFEKL